MMLFICGIPLFMAELALGQYSGQVSFEGQIDQFHTKSVFSISDLMILSLSNLGHTYCLEMPPDSQGDWLRHGGCFIFGDDLLQLGDCIFLSLSLLWLRKGFALDKMRCLVEQEKVKIRPTWGSNPRPLD